MTSFSSSHEATAQTSAPFIPASEYTSPEMLTLEKERLWPKVWQMACRLEEIPAVGDFVNYKIFDESILVTRTAKDRIQAFYNTCQHRGRRLRDDERGRAGQWYCRFHGWRYNLDGSIAYVHDREDWQACPLNDADIGLKEVRVDTWAGWVWINQDTEAQSLRKYLGEAADLLDPFELENTRIHWWSTIVAPINWKVIVEAFNEAYHAAATHTIGVHYKGFKSPGVAFGDHGMFYSISTTGELYEYLDTETQRWTEAKTAQEAIWAHNRHQFTTLFAITGEPLLAACERLHAENSGPLSGEQLALRLEGLHREEFAKRGLTWPERLTREAQAKAGVDWHLFPNTVLLPTADGALWYRARPNGDDPNSSLFDIWSLRRYPAGVAPVYEHETVEGFDAFRGRNPFLEEDFDNMEAVHQGMKSRGWAGARLNPLQEAQIANFHRALRSYIAR